MTKLLSAMMAAGLLLGASSGVAYALMAVAEDVVEDVVLEDETEMDSVAIAAIQPLTGQLQAYGETSLNGSRLAVAQVNAGGGILGGRDFEMIVGDSQTMPQAGVEVAKRLTGIENAVGIVGALGSGITIPIATSVSIPDNILHISGASTSPVITHLDDNDLVFRTIPNDELQAVILARMVQDEGLRRVGVIYVNNDYGKGLADAFVGSFEAIGGQITESVGYAERSASYRGEIRNAMRGGAEALVLIAYPEDGIPIMRQALEGGNVRRFVLTDGMKSDSVIEALGAEILEGTIGTVPQSPIESDSYQNWATQYEEHFGSAPADPFMDSVYDATFLMALAIEAAQSTEGHEMSVALRAVSSPPGVVILPGEWEKAVGLLAAGEDIDYAGAAGSQDFDEFGDVPGTYGLWRITDGAFVIEDVVSP